MNINGHDLVPTIKAPNPDMAKKFMAIMNEFLKQEQPQINLNNAASDLVKSKSMKIAEFLGNQGDSPATNDADDILDFDKKSVFKNKKVNTGNKRFKVNVNWNKPTKKIGNVTVDFGKSE